MATTSTTVCHRDLTLKDAMDIINESKGVVVYASRVFGEQGGAFFTISKAEAIRGIEDYLRAGKIPNGSIFLRVTDDGKVILS